MMVEKNSGAGAAGSVVANDGPVVDDERIQQVSLIKKLLNRPELGAVSGAVMVFIFFGFVAGDSGMFAADGVINWVTVSGQLMILSTAACLLMIAGEFDLSIGSMIGFAGMMIAIPAMYWGWPIWLSIIFAFISSMLFGFINGQLVIRTGLPSFIVTLAFLYIFRGLAIALSILFANRTIISGVSTYAEKTNDFLAPIFGGVVGGGFFQWLSDIGAIAQYSDGSAVVAGIPMVVVWGVSLSAIASWVLLKTTFGNWIFASGGDEEAARQSGVPTARVKTILFMFSAFCATVYAACQVMELGSADAARGVLKEFEAIIAAVIGGALLTGGYGSVVGACFGALIFGVVQMGILFAGFDSDWFRVFLGVMLLLAVIFNSYIRRRVSEGGK